MTLPLHQIGITEQEVFRCDVCGEEWLFNPLMFQDDLDAKKQLLAFCHGPKWIQQHLVCRAMWINAPIWRARAAVVREDDTSFQQRLIRLARYQCSGMER